MNYNIAAYADKAEAHRAYPEAPVMTLDDLLAAPAKDQS